MDALEPRRRNNPVQRRAEILDGAIRLIAQEGYYRFTLEELARCSGVSKGGLLHHFPSKEQLLLAVLEEYDGRARAALGATPDVERESVADQLRSMLAYPSQQPEHCRLYTVLRAEALNAAHPAHSYFRERERFVLETLTAVLAPFATDPQAAARQLHALMEGLVLQWLSADCAFDLIEQWERALTALLPKLKVER